VLLPLLQHGVMHELDTSMVVCFDNYGLPCNSWALGAARLFTCRVSLVFIPICHFGARWDRRLHRQQAEQPVVVMTPSPTVGGASYNRVEVATEHYVAGDPGGFACPGSAKLSFGKLKAMICLLILTQWLSGQIHCFSWSRVAFWC
jgi:hypothetical protein